MVITNANQTTPLGMPAAVFGDVPRAVSSTSVPSTANDLVVDLLAFYAFEYTPGNGQTERIVSDNNGSASSRMSTKSGAAGSTTMSWTVTSLDPTETSQIGVAVKAR